MKDKHKQKEHKVDDKSTEGNLLTDLSGWGNFQVAVAVGVVIGLLFLAGLAYKTTQDLVELPVEVVTTVESDVPVVSDDQDTAKPDVIETDPVEDVDTGEAECPKGTLALTKPNGENLGCISLK